MSVLDEFKSMDELISGWAKPTMTDIPFQELLRRVGYHK